MLVKRLGSWDQVSNVFMFDLDGTLIVYDEKPKATFTWWNEIVPVVLRKLMAEGYGIIIVSNQSRYNKIIEDKINNLLILLDSFNPYLVEVYISTKRDLTRKPETKMLLPIINNLKKVIFVGDAAGRPGDFADSDRKFAFNLQLLLSYQYNLGLKNNNLVQFQTPEEFFLKIHVDLPPLSGFNPAQYLATLNNLAFPKLPNKTYYVINSITSVMIPPGICVEKYPGVIDKKNKYTELFLYVEYPPVMLPHIKAFYRRMGSEYKNTTIRGAIKIPYWPVFPDDETKLYFLQLV